MHETHQLAHEPASVAVARHELRDLLEREGVGESVVYDATLVLSELVSNAVRHGRPTAAGHVEVSWSLEPERLVLEGAEDPGPGPQSAAERTVSPESSVTTTAVAASRSRADCRLQTISSAPVPRNSPAGVRVPSASTKAAR